MSNRPDRPTCGAKARSTGLPCRAPAMPNGRCRVHGGSSRPPGPTHPRYRTGRYSKALDGEAIAALYELARTDPKLLALKDDIAVLVALQQRTLDGLRTGESGAGWDALAVQLKALRAALARGAEEECTAALDGMDAVLRGALGDRHVWEEYTARTEQIRKLVDTERKYEEGLRLYLPLEQANAIMGVWLDCIRRVVPPEYIAKLHEEVRRVRTDMPSMSPATDHVH